MKLLRKLDNYLNESEYKIISNNKYVNITNYTKILDFDSNKVEIIYDSNKLLIEGTNLIIKKMMNNELLVTGNISSLIYK